MNTVTLAFAAGLVAAINPCGFALLPAYLAYYLGLTGTDPDAGPQRPNALRALSVAGAMSLGFVVVFGVIGAVWSVVGSFVGGRLPWVTVVLGILVVIAGIAMTFGAQPVLHLPQYHAKKGNADELASMFLFGVSYATASLSCTLPVFIALITTTFSRESVITGMAAFVAYALGMSVVVAVLTLAVSFARQGIVNRMRSVLPYVGRIGGVLMVIAGAFVVYYGWWELSVQKDPESAGGLGTWATRAQSTISGWSSDVGEVRIGLIGMAVIVVLVLISRRRPKSPDPVAGA